MSRTVCYLCLIAIIQSVFLIGCNRSGHTLDVPEIFIPEHQPKESMALSDFTDSISYVYLEATESSFIGEVTDLRISKQFISDL